MKKVIKKVKSVRKMWNSYVLFYISKNKNKPPWNLVKYFIDLYLYIYLRILTKKKYLFKDLGLVKI